MSAPSQSVAADSASLLSTLSVQQQVRLTEILDEYLQSLEEHDAPPRSELLARHPELAEVLAVYLDKLEQLHGLTGQAAGGGLVGQKLGDYELKAEIGRGGMGVVFSAWDTKLDRMVAVKLLPMADLLDEKYVQRFRNEARAAASLEQPHIVPVYAIGHQQGIHYYAMRLIDGPSLDQRIDQHRSQGSHPPTIRVLEQFAQVADALNTAHQHGIVHRDIKPSNLLLDSRQRLWLADFGLARFQTATPLTQTGDMIGTMRYMSPEQASGRSELVDHRTDIYSLGATLFELLALRPVVEGEDGPQLLRVIENLTLPKLRKYRPDCGSDLQTVLEKAMSHGRDDRYATAGELANDLRAIVAGQPIAARPISGWTHARRFAARNSRAITAAVAATLLVSAGVLYAVLKINYHDAARHESFVSARAGFRAVLDAADKFANVPGSEAARRTALLNALSYFEDFSRQANNDPALRRDQAQAHARIGAIHEELGNLLDATEHFETAEKYYTEIQLTNEPSLASDGNSLASARSENLNHLAMAYANGGKKAEALDALHKAIRLQERITTPEGRAALGLTHSNLGLVYEKTGQRDKAREAYQHAIRTLEKVADDAGDDAATLRSLAAAYQNYAVLLRKNAVGSQNSADAAEATLETAAGLLEQALELQQALAKQPGDRSRMDPDLVSTYLHLGEVRLAQDQSPAARESFRAAEFLCEKLVSISPAPRYRRDLAISQTNLAMTLFDQGEKRAALKRLKAAQANYSRLLSQTPDNAEFLTSMGISLNNQATVLQGLNRAEDALFVYNEAEKYLVRAQGIAPTEQQKTALVRIYQNHAQLLTMADREAEANQLNQKRIALGGPLSSHSRERATP